MLAEQGLDFEDMAAEHQVAVVARNRLGTSRPKPLPEGPSEIHPW